MNLYVLGNLPSRSSEGVDPKELIWKLHFEKTNFGYIDKNLINTYKIYSKWLRLKWNWFLNSILHSLAKELDILIEQIL